MTKTRFSIPAQKPSAAEAFVAGAETASTPNERLIQRFPVFLTDTDFARLKHHCKVQERSSQYFVRKALLKMLDDLDAEEHGARR